MSTTIFPPSGVRAATPHDYPDGPHEGEGQIYTSSFGCLPAVVRLPSPLNMLRVHVYASTMDMRCCFPLLAVRLTTYVRGISVATPSKRNCLHRMVHLHHVSPRSGVRTSTPPDSLHRPHDGGGHGYASSLGNSFLVCVRPSRLTRKGCSRFYFNVKWDASCCCPRWYHRQETFSWFFCTAVAGSSSCSLKMSSPPRHCLQDRSPLYTRLPVHQRGLILTTFIYTSINMLSYPFILSQAYTTTK